jgi:hypothetical protein
VERPFGSGPHRCGQHPSSLLPHPANFWDARLALISALLLAVSPWHLIWSQTARFYPALMLFYMLALLAIFSGLERDRPWQLVAGLLFFYLALSERIFALLLGPVVATYLLLVWLLPWPKPAGFNRRNLFILSLPVIVGLLAEGINWLMTGYSRFFGDFGWFFLYVNNTPARLLGTTLFNVGLPWSACPPGRPLFIKAKKPFRFAASDGCPAATNLAATTKPLYVR